MASHAAFPFESIQAFSMHYPPRCIARASNSQQYRFRTFIFASLAGARRAMLFDAMTYLSPPGDEFIFPGRAHFFRCLLPTTTPSARRGATTIRVAFGRATRCDFSSSLPASRRFRHQEGRHPRPSPAISRFPVIRDEPRFAPRHLSPR